MGSGRDAYADDVEDAVEWVRSLSDEERIRMGYKR